MKMSGFVECAICDISFFGTSATLEKHTNDVHNGQKKFERASAKNKSLSQNQVENITMGFSCKYCDKSYTQLALNKHIRFCDKKILVMKLCPKIITPK